MEQHNIMLILNQFFEVQKKVRGSDLERSVERNLRRIEAQFLEAGYRVHDPTGEPYDLTRLDCEAMVSGEKTDRLIIVETVKPVIYDLSSGQSELLQKGVVIVEQKAS